MIGSGFPDGDEPADPIVQPAGDGLAGFARQTEARFVNLARRLMARLHLDTVELAAEGAVHNAWLVILGRLRCGELQPIQTLTDFVKIFTLLLRHVIADEWRRQRADKRARGRGVPDSALDGVASLAVPTDDYVIGAQQAEELLDMLDHEDASLREIAILKVQEFSNAEIASKLGVSISTIERMLRKSRTILGSHRNDRKRS